MFSVTTFIVWAMVVLVLLLVAVLDVEILMGVIRRRRTSTAMAINTVVESRPPAWVIIPAHDEALTLPATLTRLAGELAAQDQVLVVADNCTDDTADLARACGVNVIERQDSKRRGKGYAMDAGCRWFTGQQTPPGIVVFLDADCHFEAGGLERLVRAADKLDVPVQAQYLMTADGASSLQLEVREFAWLVKNLARPLGLAALAMPCQLMGTGMAIPWRWLSRVEFATGNIVEDLQLGLDFASAGGAPRFCPEAVVKSTFPTTVEAGQEQHTRWEHGQLGLIVERVPALLFQALRTGNWPLASLVMDLCVPPLALLAQMLFLATATSTLFWAIGGGALPLLGSILAVVAFVLGIGLSWYVYGRPVLSLRALLSIPHYVLNKLPLYFGFLKRRQRDWVRAKRG